LERKRNGSDYYMSTASRGDVARRFGAGFVGMIGDEDLVPGLEYERAQHRVDAGGRVGDEREVGGIGADESAEPCQRLVEPAP
jgi:hypothetical protein